MAPDQFQEVTRQGYGSRITSSLKGALFGIVLFLGSFVLFWWNEGNLAEEKSAFSQISKEVKRAPVDRIDSNLTGKLVHVTAHLSSEEMLGDEEYLDEGEYLALERHVEMFQWVERTDKDTKEKLGGSSETTTTYRYTKEWKSGRVDSSEFKQVEGHQNPALSVEEGVWRVSESSFGPYDGSGIVERLDPQEELPLSSGMLLKSEAEQEGSYLTIRKGTGDTLGDIRMKYFAVRPSTFSIIAVQTPGNGFEAYHLPNDRVKFLIEEGTKSPEEIIANARSAAGMFAWILRGVGFLMMWFGMSLFFQPLAMLLAIVPPAAGLGRALIGGFTFLLALVLSIVTIILCYIARNPLVLLVAVVLTLALGLYFYRRRVAKTPSSAPPPLGNTSIPPPIR